ncbi:putative nuclear pore complex protein [Apostichopus japonicus]|uniref:Nuclear pore complex protein n=1 Tax=Stichopus japonicus TaxID=307972 RepID=A0A2G8JI83_STIJA|nr:putative nuclear pore complex protein [Apostichopus japonicus]
METSHNLPGKSMLTTPSLRAKTAVDQSVMLTPGGPLDDTRFDKFNLLVEADPGVAETPIACSHRMYLLPACNTWADYLWAYFKVMVDQKVEQTLRDHLTLSRPLEPLPPNFDQKLLTVQGIFHELQAAPHKSVETQAKFKQHIVQKYMILDELDALTEEMAEWLSNSNEAVEGHMIRFMAHFTLIIRSLGLQTREEMSVRIIEAFVKDLIASNRTELVAIYVAQLPPSLQVAYYAKFLEGISEQDDQQRCLRLAEDAVISGSSSCHSFPHRFGCSSYYKNCCENIRTQSDDAISEIIPSDSLEAVTTEEDQRKIDAITWLVFDPWQRSEALKQSNALIRTFLELKKHDAAREVFQKVPADSIDVIMRNWQSSAGSEPLPPDDDNAIREHLCIKSYLDALDAFNDWFNHYHNKKPNGPVYQESASFHDRVRFEHEEREFEMELNKWDQTLSILTKTVCDTAYNVLLFVNGGWMVDQREGHDPDAIRGDQLVRLRERCIPLLCTLLHTVLHTRGLYRECLALADEIASEEFQLYKVFKKEELKQFLSKLRESSSCLLDQDLDALGFEI